MQHICPIYAAYFSAYFAKFHIFFPHILHQNGPHILRKISAINRYPYSVHAAGGVTVRKLDLRSKAHEFDSRLGRYQVVTSRMGGCSLTSKPSRYITTTKVNSAFYPSRVGKSSTSLHCWGYGGARSYGRWRFVALQGFPIMSYRYQ